jgi:hypothetical protein
LELADRNNSLGSSFNSPLTPQERGALLSRGGFSWSFEPATDPNIEHISGNGEHYTSLRITLDGFVLLPTKTLKERKRKEAAEAALTGSPNAAEAAISATDIAQGSIDEHVGEAEGRGQETSVPALFAAWVTANPPSIPGGEGTPWATQPESPEFLRGYGGLRLAPACTDEVIQQGTLPKHVDVAQHSRLTEAALPQAA